MNILLTVIEKYNNDTIFTKLPNITTGTLGYGWNLKHKNFWPNYMDLTQWLEVNTWGDVNKCEVYVNGEFLTLFRCHN